MPFFSPKGQRWIENQTGENVSLGSKPDVPPWKSQQRTQEAALSPASNLDMPDRKITEEYFSLFCSSPFRFVFPIVDPVLFRDTINIAYEPWEGMPSTEPVAAQACVLLFVSVISLMEGTLETMPIDSDACSTKAQSLLPQVLLDTSTTALQAAFMQVSKLEGNIWNCLNDKLVYALHGFWKFSGGYSVSCSSMSYSVVTRCTHASDRSYTKRIIGRDRSLLANEETYAQLLLAMLCC